MAKLSRLHGKQEKRWIKKEREMEGRAKRAGRVKDQSIPPLTSLSSPHALTES